MQRKGTLILTVLIVVGIALVSTALVLAEDADQPATAPAQDGPGASGAELIQYLMDEDYTSWGSWTADRWTDFDGYLESGAPHGNTVRIFVNKLARDAARADDFDGTLPAGSIVVKENYGGTVDEPGELAALTVMYKVEGFNPDANDWFWVKTGADPMQIDAEGAVEGCIGCHSQDGNADYLLRYAFGEEPAAFTGTPLPEADAAAILTYLLETDSYTEWGSWPTDEINTDDYSGYLASGAPHGNTVRIFVNERGLNALESEHFHGTFPPGTIVIKENFGGTVDAPGDLAAITLMYKVDGFDPANNDWFWIKTGADPMQIDASGMVEGCIGCHSQDGNSDYLLRFNTEPYAQPMMDDMMGDDMGDDDMSESDDMGGDDMAMLDGNALVDERCTVCHSRERIDAAMKSAEEWTVTIDRMIAKGANVSDDEKAAMIAFLTGG